MIVPTMPMMEEAVSFATSANEVLARYTAVAVTLSSVAIAPVTIQSA